MPSPIVHVSVGYAIWVCVRARCFPALRPRLQGAWQVLPAALALSMLPDADALPGILFGDLRRFHNNLTHSVLAGVLAAAACAWIARMLHAQRPSRWLLLALLCYGTHLLMDYFTGGRGILLLWPFTAARFQSPVILFHGLQWSARLLDPTHLLTLLNEIPFAAAVILLAHAYGMRTRRNAD